MVLSKQQSGQDQESSLEMRKEAIVGPRKLARLQSFMELRSHRMNPEMREVVRGRRKLSQLVTYLPSLSVS